MYDQDGFQVSNSINRFAIGDRDKLAFNADGSLDIYVQAESPSKDKESNWLPAPKNAPFQPTLRTHRGQRSRTAYGHRRHSGRCIEREYSIAEPSSWPPRQSQTSDGRPAERKPT